MAFPIGANFFKEDGWRRLTAMDKGQDYVDDGGGEAGGYLRPLTSASSLYYENAQLAFAVIGVQRASDRSAACRELATFGKKLKFFSFSFYIVCLYKLCCVLFGSTRKPLKASK